MQPPLPTAVDLLVLGAGAGGMTAALTGAILGLDVVVIEKTGQIGGTSARSAGSVWVPNSRHSRPGTDSFEAALTYLRQAVGNRLDQERITGFLQAAPEMVDFLEDNSPVKLRAYPYHPDYLADLDGASLSGRVVEPLPFNAAVLGPAFANLRPPLAEFMLFGGMMVDRTDIGHLLGATRKMASFWHSIKLLTGYGRDRLRYRRGARLVMGNALVGRLYHALLQRRVPVLLSTTVTSLAHENGRVTGVVINSKDQRSEIQVRAGVVLATGGISNNPALRKSLMPAALFNTSPVVDSATGDGLTLAGPAGGHLSRDHDSNSFLAPLSRRRRGDGSIAVFPHFVLDRGKPGILAVDPGGNRFVNEATTYHLFGKALLATLARFPGRGCFLICDDPFMARYGLGMVRPKRLGLDAAVRDGYVIRAGTLAELAEKAGLPGDATAAAVARHNGFASDGVDQDFAKGEDAYQQNLGDPAHSPNPCLGACASPPFYALEIFPGDIGASTGLVTNAAAQVLDENGNPIAGLYACGNDMESIMAGFYPGPGITLGPAMTFGFVAARHAHAAAATPGTLGKGEKS